VLLEWGDGGCFGAVFAVYEAEVFFPLSRVSYVEEGREARGRTCEIEFCVIGSVFRLLEVALHGFITVMVRARHRWHVHIGGFVSAFVVEYGRKNQDD
jgi:hypothetical protein